MHTDVQEGKKPGRALLSDEVLQSRQSRGTCAACVNGCRHTASQAVVVWIYPYRSAESVAMYMHVDQPGSHDLALGIERLVLPCCEGGGIADGHNLWR